MILINMNTCESNLQLENGHEFWHWKLYPHLSSCSLQQNENITLQKATIWLKGCIWCGTIRACMRNIAEYNFLRHKGHASSCCKWDWGIWRSYKRVKTGKISSSSGLQIFFKKRYSKIFFAPYALWGKIHEMSDDFVQDL